MATKPYSNVREGGKQECYRTLVLEPSVLEEIKTKQPVAHQSIRAATKGQLQDGFGARF